MKKIIIAATIFGTSLFNGSDIYGSVNMNKKLKEMIIFENGMLPLEKDASEFVRVSFKINEEGLVEIIGMNYSDELVKNQLVEKLSEIKVNENHDTKEIYNYNFTFKKI
jgi:hypothetical protein